MKMDDRKRFSIQAVSTLLHNANLKGFFTGRIWQGASKGVCVPGLNCYSCPGAVGACPIGSLQSFLGSRPVRIPYYIVGLLVFFGALLGRAVCGFLCPFGFLQELLHRIPFPKKIKGFRGDGVLRRLKYVILALLVVLPLFFALTPFFCKYLCPAGTLAGVLLALADKAVRPLLGGLFAWKAALLVAIAALSLLIWRPFCKYLCPLGAVYGLFNRFALFRGELDADKCVRCGKCASACRMGVEPTAHVNSAECIRCGDCARACPTGAIRMGFPRKK
ncbi:MAG: 4Fe-4S binding protein [Oscillospiraceae bacterium]|nr:4Fe-4S binding protein [Oscillospiraceae bacterium]